MNQPYSLSFGRFLEPRNWWLRHLCFWFYRFSDSIFGAIGLLDRQDYSLYEMVTGYFLVDAALVYFNLLVLVPRLLLKKHIRTYVLASLVAIFIYAIYGYTTHPTVCTDCSTTTLITEFYIYDVLDGVQLLGLTTGLRLIVEYFYATRRMQQLESANLESELAFLKAQLNPHFLFNTLNNIAVLSEKYPDRVTSVVVQLAQTLRYQLYESEKEKVSLAGDIENLRNILQLEALRLNKAETEISVEGKADGLVVAPHLFLPFLENAVKHSADTSKPAIIHFLFKIEEKKVVFTAENSKPSIAPNIVAGGIGLKNLRRRLELLYPNRHELSIDDQPNRFTARLILDLKN